MSASKIIIPSLLMVLIACGGAFAKDSAKVSCPGEELVDVTEFIDDAIINMRYATENNFLKRKLYSANVCLLRKSVTMQLIDVAEDLRERDLRLVLWDCYRPRRVQYEMWKVHPVRGEVANPKTGSNHNRGSAVDLTLADKDGRLLKMPTDFDDFSKAAWRNANIEDKEAKKNRELLKKSMKKAGFTGIKREWWHFNASRAKSHALCDLPLIGIEKGKP